MKDDRSYALLPLRLYCGWVFLTSGLSKISAGWLDRPELTRVLDGWIRSGMPYRFYQPILERVVIPHAKLFAVLVVFGELLVGVSLLAGLFSRLAAWGGLFLVTAFLLARGEGFSANATAPFVAITLTLALTRPGRTLGLDGALRGKVPDWLC